VLRILLLPVFFSVLGFNLLVSPTPQPNPTSSVSLSNSTNPTAAPIGTTVTLTVDSLIKMGTAGTVLPTGLPVTLHLLRATANSGTTEPVTMSLMANNADVPLHFAPFVALVGDICVLTVTYQGITQGSVPHTVQMGEAALDLPIMLYDKTTDASNIKITETTQTLHFAPGNLIAVLETVDWVTTGDRFYLSDTKTDGGDPISVQLTLPVGARGVAFSTQPVRRFVISGNAIGDIERPEPRRVRVADVCIVPGPGMGCEWICAESSRRRRVPRHLLKRADMIGDGSAIEEA